MRNTSQVNSISVQVHWHVVQIAVSDKQLPPFNIENVYIVSTKGKCRMISKEELFSNKEFTVHQVLIHKMNGKHGNSRTKSDKQHLYNKFHSAALVLFLKIVLQVHCSAQQLKYLSFQKCH